MRAFVCACMCADLSLPLTLSLSRRLTLNFASALNFTASMDPPADPLSTSLDLNPFKMYCTFCLSHATCAWVMRQWRHSSRSICILIFFFAFGLLSSFSANWWSENIKSCAVLNANKLPILACEWLHRNVTCNKSRMICRHTYAYMYMLW